MRCHLQARQCLSTWSSQIFLYLTCPSLRQRNQKIWGHIELPSTWSLKTVDARYLTARYVPPRSCGWRASKRFGPSATKLQRRAQRQNRLSLCDDNTSAQSFAVHREPPTVRQEMRQEKRQWQLRPSLNSQCRPPETSALQHTQLQLNRYLQRPPRSSQFRPPETFRHLVMLRRCRGRV